MNCHDNLDRLRAVIATECDRRMMQDHQLRTSEVAEWLVCHQSRTVIKGLADLVSQVMERQNDDDRVKRLLRAWPELKRLEKWMSQISETLGVPLWYLLPLDIEKSERCWDAASFVHQLRSEEAAAQHSEGDPLYAEPNDRETEFFTSWVNEQQQQGRTDNLTFGDYLRETGILPPRIKQ